MSLTNFDLEELGRLLKIHVVVLLQEELVNRNINTKNGKYIINLTDDVQKNGGTHWIAVQTKNGTVVHYDSFGAPISTKIKAWIKRGKPKKIGYSNHIKQALESELCGWYCLGFLVYNSRSTKSSILESSNDWVNQYSSNPDFNAGRIRMFMNAWIDKSKLPLRLSNKLHEKIIYT